MIFSLPIPVFFLLFLPLFFPASRALSSKRGGSFFWALSPVFLFFVLLLLLLIFHSSCTLCHSLPREGLLLSLALAATFLAYLPALPLEERRSPAPILMPAVLSLGTGVFLQGSQSGVLAGGGLLALSLLFSVLFLGGAYPGAYQKFFPVRLGGAVLALGALSFPAMRQSLTELLLVLTAAILLLLPAPFPRRTETVLSPGFLRADQALFVCLPPLLIFHILRAIPGGGLSISPMLPGLGILLALTGLLYAKISLFVEEMAEGLTVAGTGFLLAGFLTFRPEGREGALFMALLLPLSTALSGLSLSFLAQRFRNRTFQGLAGQGTGVEPLRLAYLFGAFQGMSLPVVGGFLGEWILLRAVSESSLVLSILAVVGIFLVFVLVLGRTVGLFSGEPVQRLSEQDTCLASEILPSEGWSLWLASTFLLAIDLLGTFGLGGGR